MADKDVDLTGKDPNIQSIPDCYVRVVHYFQRDTRLRDRRDKKPRPVIISDNLSDKILGIRHTIKKAQVTDSRTFDIASDVIACSVFKTKSAPAGRFSLILSPGDINYHHVIHPGDHIFIWMKRRRPSVMVKGTAREIEDSGVCPEAECFIRRERMSKTLLSSQRLGIR